MNKKIKADTSTKAGKKSLQKSLLEMSATLDRMTRELEIEAALEMIRTAAMGMKKPGDLLNINEALFKELLKLGFTTLRNTMIHTFADEEHYFTDYDYSGLNGGSVNRIPYSGHPVIETFIQNIRKTNDAFTQSVLQGKELEDWKAFRKNNGEADDPQLDKINTLYYYNYSAGPAGIGISTFSAIPDEQREVLKRFRNVFDFAYRRYADVTQAEAQTREARVELALEKVRARTMAMHKSEEFMDVINVVSEQLQQLNINIHIAGFSLDYKAHPFNIWMAAPSQPYPSNIDVPYREIPMMQRIKAAIDSRLDFYTDTFSFEEKNQWLDNVLENTIIKYAPEERKIFMLNAPGLTISIAMQQHTALMMGNYAAIPYTDDQHTVLKRFAAVFEQTYIRFLDLQKAEAQTREAQIEAALERVRSKTMAMHNSADVGETAAVMVDELKKLGIETIRCGIGILHEPGDMEVWTIRTDANDTTDIIIGWLDMNMHPLLHGAFENWRNKNEHYSYELKGDDLLNYYTAINHYPGYPIRYDVNALPGLIFHNEFYFAEGTLFAFSLEQLSLEQKKIFKRFAGVFGQTYRRYLDLKRAEAQAREARIETALERVRAVAMSMMKSNDLLTICESVFTQVTILGFTGIRSAQIYIRNDELEKFTNYDYSDITGSDIVEVSYNSHPKTRRIYDTIKNAGDAFLENIVSKEELEAWKLYLYNTLGQKPEKGLDTATALHYYFYSVGTGALALCTFQSLSQDQLEILKRFRNVFNLCYQRYTDIALAEAQAREAHIEAALERVRSRTLAMQKSDELAATAAVVFRQLIGLGIEPNRLYITIIKDDSGDMEFWITGEDGTNVGNKFSGNAHRNISFQKMYDGWAAHKKSITIDMQGEELVNYFQHLHELGVPFKPGLTQKRRIQNIAYFGKGFIGMASPDEQPEATTSLLERFAAAFNLTYTRFNDLQVAETHAVQAGEDLVKLQTEKRRAEDALTELRQTQKQLIQSEKMASLGELTAGIAHEIQNPLNFVNNFSEISNELIEEMNAEMEKGDMAEAKAIANDIKKNLEKINHHGKRADAIVKGMLQHSQSSTGHKASTNINRLADEYLRLAYHGLRAKDKLFNAILQTDYDETTGNIDIIPQDIGRVMLNVITNAFYATSEKKKMQPGYEPMVIVSTKRTRSFEDGRGEVQIKVADNGNGIPPKIIDKIFQPFFTTKPTGQGTGLGLSLAYDIVKAHGGELTAETKEGQGTAFIIQLPVM